MILRGLSDQRPARRRELDRRRQGVEVKHLGTAAVVGCAGGRCDCAVCRRSADAAVAVVRAGPGSHKCGHGGALEVEAASAVALVVVLEEEVRQLRGRRRGLGVQGVGVVDAKFGCDAPVSEQERKSVACGSVSVAADVVVAVSCRG